MTFMVTISTLPNQELSGAKSELQGETVAANPPSYNLPARPPSVFTTKPASVLTSTF